MIFMTFDWIVIGLLVGILILLCWILLLIKRNPNHQSSMEPVLREEFSTSRNEASQEASRTRSEISRIQAESGKQLSDFLQKIGDAQGKRIEDVYRQLGEMTRLNKDSSDKLRETVEKKLEDLQKSNEKKLDQIRKTVDDQLQDALEKRLGESFKLVSERLEQVHKGLGEMKELATGVGDLKRVLTNVKARGTWGEVQLGALLEQMLTPHQYERNVKPDPDSDEMVEFAVKLPGMENEADVWLPIDAKFPQESYLRLLEASESGNKEAVQQESKTFSDVVDKAAADIRSKYICPPHTTDFGILFLPTEGLYAEVVRNPELLDRLQQRHKVVVAGPVTLAAILNSLQMGFRTLAIEKRSSEVWAVLSGVKTEFGKFGGVLDKVKKQLDRASRSIDETGTRTRAIERKLRDVQELPVDPEMAGMLGLVDEDVNVSTDGE